MKGLLALLVACGSMAGLAYASGSPTPPPSSATIQALVDRLGAEGFADREAASTALEKIGPSALDALRVAMRSENPEIRDRATVLFTKLQRVADSAAYIAAKRVTLSYKDMPLGSALNELKSQTGLNLALDPNRVANPLRRITCETQELPVWEALEAFCEAAGLREVFTAELEIPKSTVPRRGYVPPVPAPSADNVPVKLIDGKANRLAGDRSTAVRVMVLPATFSGHKVTLGTGEVNLCLDVTPAPGVAWQEVMGVKISRVVDSAGRSGGAGTEKTQPSNFDPSGMMVFVRPGVAMRFDGMGNIIQPESQPNPRVLTVPLRIGTPSATSLKRLEGVVFGEVYALNQPLITVTDPKRNTGVGVPGPGELRFTVLEVKESPGPNKPGTIKAQLEYPSPWAINARRRGGWNPGWPEAPRHPSLGNRVEVFDAAGKPFPVTSRSDTDMSDDGIVNVQTITFSFSAASGLPAKIAVVGPRSVLVQIPFALENVPLP